MQRALQALGWPQMGDQTRPQRGNSCWVREGASATNRAAAYTGKGTQESQVTQQGVRGPPSRSSSERCREDQGVGPSFLGMSGLALLPAHSSTSGSCLAGSDLSPVQLARCPSICVLCPQGAGGYPTAVLPHFWRRRELNGSSNIPHLQSDPVLLNTPHCLTSCKGKG